MSYYDDIVKKLRELASAIEKDEDISIDGRSANKARLLAFDLPISSYSLPPPDPYASIKKAYKAGHRIFVRGKDGGLISVVPDWTCAPESYCWIEKECFKACITE